MKKPAKTTALESKLPSTAGVTTDELISVKLDNGDIWHYEYDVFGRRIRKYLSQQTTIKQTETYYQWQAQQLKEL